MALSYITVAMVAMLVCVSSHDSHREMGVPRPTLASSYELQDLKLVLSEFSQGLFITLTERLERDRSFGDSDTLQDCYNDTGKVLEDLEAGSPYSLRYLDAAGKVPSGILDLKWIWMGDYQECKSVPRVFNPGTGHDFGGKHFLVLVYVNGKPIFSAVPLPLAIGLCMPDSCNNNTVAALLSVALSDIKNITIAGVESAEKLEYSTGAIVALVVCGVLGCLVVLGTLLDLWEQRGKREKPGLSEHPDFNSVPTERTGLLAGELLEDNIQGTKSRCKQTVSGVLKCFSFTGNTSKLLSTATAVGPLACLNGLRVISMWWVIQGHTYSFSTMFLDNIPQAEKITKRFDFQAIINGTFSVDTFFFLSGLLVAYLALKEMREKGRLNWIYFFVHRYWRLTPMYAILLMILTTLIFHVVYGPYQFVTTIKGSFVADAASSCGKYWWTNLLYINNFYPHYGSDDTTCMPWAWYLANDMQFYVVFSPIVILLLHKNKRIGVIVTVLLIAIGVAIRGGLASYYGMRQLGDGPQKHTDNWAQNGILYQRPYARYSVYLVGMLTGYVLCATNCKLRMNKVFSMIGWICATANALAVIYGQYYYNSHPGSHMTPLAAGFYISLCRTAWSVSLAWVVLACACGYGGPVYSILSFKIWAPLGRLTYAAYLAHPLWIVAFYANFEVPLHFTDLMMIYVFLGNLVMSYGIAYVVSMAVEAPMIQIEKLVIKHFGIRK